jgi:putative DNA primase/helicase
MENPELHHIADSRPRETRSTAMKARRSSAADVASALGGTSAGEGQWQACCPAHPDKNPSLSVGTGRNSKVLLHCFAGCDPNDILDALERNHGLVLRAGKGAAKPRQATRKAKSLPREDDATASVSTAEPQPSQRPANANEETPEESGGPEPSGCLPAEDASKRQGGNGHAEADDTFVPIIPPPEEASTAELMHGGPGQFTVAFRFENAVGELEGYVRRFDFMGKDGEPDKVFLPLRYGHWKGSVGWHKKGWRGKGVAPFFLLRRLLAMPGAPVLVTEGEKKAAAATELFPDLAAISPMNGAKSPAKTDWSPLRNRNVVIWPDNDQPGAEFAQTVARLATDAGATGAWIVRVPDHFPEKWDLANPPPEGADLRALLKAAEPPKAADEGEYPPAHRRPCFRVYDDDDPAGFPREAKARAGVYWHEARTQGDEVELIDTWICGPLYVEAQTHDEHANNFGRRLRFKTSADTWRDWSMPQEMLAGEATQLRAELLAMGLLIGHSAKERALFADYLQHRTPKARIRCATSVGWCGRAFVLPDEVIGPGADGVIFQSGERVLDEYALAGDLDGWRESVAAMAIGNPILMMAVSAAFAGPLILPASQEPAGLHLVGDSSTGKSTALEAARSVWGGPTFKRSWRATANGLESVAQLHNDCLLPLDELSECDPHEAGAVSYMLANGQGKSRANRVGGARIVRRWRTFVLSTGERTLEATLAEGGRRVKAGQSVRLLDIPVQRQFGVFDDLKGFDSGRALADAIKKAASQHYGAAGRVFLERLTRDPRDFGGLLEEAKSLPMFAAEGMSGQEMRAAGRFALIGIAGELATEYGLTGWPEGEAIAAAAEGLRLWRSYRSKGDAEPIKILEAVRDFLDRHGDSRFTDITNVLPNPLIRDRAGWWREGGEAGREYLFTSAGLRDATKGFDVTRVVMVLQEKGVIPPAGKDGKRSHPEWLPNKEAPKGKKRMRTYNVNIRKLEELIHDA